MTLFRKALTGTPGKIIDLGCGDGTFSAMAGYDRNIEGFDYDRSSIDAARMFFPRRRFTQTDITCIPMDDCSADTCVSNSVFEHVANITNCFTECRRILRPQGSFIFSITLRAFHKHLDRLCGRRDSLLWKSIFNHNTNLSAAEVVSMLTISGFQVERSVEYQPITFTATYRLMISPVFQFLERRWSTSTVSALRSRLAPMVEQSISSTEAGDGACLFVVCRKI